MTTSLVTKRFRTRRPELPAPKPVGKPGGISPDAFLPPTDADGFGNQTFATARGAAPGGPAAAPAAVPAALPGASIDTIRQEGLTGRQLRMARRLAQQHGLPATSDFDAVRLLRQAGIDPFQPNAVLGIVQGGSGGEAPPTGKALATVPGGDGVRLPQTIKPMQVPSTEVRVEQAHIAEVSRIQADIARRRRRNSILLAARLAIFVLLPTLLAGYYFSSIATPMYSTNSAFVIAESNPAATGGLGGLLSNSPLGTNRDAIAVQGYLQSMEAMERLDKETGFRAHFSGDEVDSIQRLADGAPNTALYAIYKKHVRVSYDPMESVIKMEVITPDPAVGVSMSEALIRYAEEQLASMTEKQRDDHMKGARESYEDAEAKLKAANDRVVELQEKLKVLSPEIEISLLTSQIGTLEAQITQDKLALAEMEANQNPNKSRVEPLKRRIEVRETEVAELRARLTEGDGTTQSIARIQSELLVAQTDVTTRTMLVGTALQAMEAARIEANRQNRYLNRSINPVISDAPAYPRVFENTAVTLLICLGAYLVLAMTVAILREQMSA